MRWLGDAGAEFDAPWPFARALKVWSAGKNASGPFRSSGAGISELARRFELSLLPKRAALVRLASDAAIPPWAVQGDFFSVTRTGDELSLVCDEKLVPAGVKAEAGWRILKVKGPFALSEIGVLAALAMPLAQAKVSLFAISTVDTDYLLVSEKQLDAGVAALRAAGHHVQF